MAARFFPVLGLTAVLQIASVSSTFAVEVVPEQHVKIRVEGPLAFVTVTRSFFAGQHAPRAKSRMAVFDVALPVGAEGFAAEILAPVAKAAWQPLTAAAAGEAQEVPTGAIKAPADPEARHRVVVQGVGEQDWVQLRYTYAVPLRCQAGQWTLSIPGNVDLSPIASQVEVQTRLPAGLRLVSIDVAGQTTKINRRVVAQAPAQAAWDLRLNTALRAQRSGTAMGARWKPMAGKASAWWGVCRSVSQPQRTWPSTVVVVVDLSRSVGAVGLALQRDFVRAFLEALPTGTRWNAVLFNRTADTLFPVFRLITSESLTALDEALVPGGLQNGTEPTQALALAAKFMRREANETQSDAVHDAWLMMVSDGALPEGTALTPHSDPSPPWNASAAVLLRPEDEQAPDAKGRQTIYDFVRPQLGLFRTLQPPGVREAAQAAVNDLRRGGDWFLQTGTSSNLAPEAGMGGFVTQPANPPTRVRFVAGGQPSSLPIAYVRTRPWPPASTPQTLTQALGPGQQAYLLPVAPAPQETTPGGELERSVLKNALALAYLPRARACYLNRSAKTFADRELSGRVRLSLQLERGEVLGVQTLSSTLARPVIEACLLEAAYALHIPRPAGRDAPVEAILNLVFRPSSPLEPEARGAVVDHDIELLLGPMRRGESQRFDQLLLDEAPPPP